MYLQMHIGDELIDFAEINYYDLFGIGPKQRYLQLIAIGLLQRNRYRISRIKSFSKQIKFYVDCVPSKMK